MRPETQVRHLELASGRPGLRVSPLFLGSSVGITEVFLPHTPSMSFPCQTAGSGVGTSHVALLSPGSRWSALWDGDAFLAPVLLTSALTVHSVPERLTPQNSKTLSITCRGGRGGGENPQNTSLVNSNSHHCSHFLVQPCSPPLSRSLFLLLLILSLSLSLALTQLLLIPLFTGTTGMTAHQMKRAKVQKQSSSGSQVQA